MMAAWSWAAAGQFSALISVLFALAINGTAADCNTNADCGHGVCVKPPPIANYSYCECDAAYASRFMDRPCQYKRKTQLAAFLLTIFLGQVGVGWLYVLRIGEGVGTLVLWLATSAFMSCSGITCGVMSTVCGKLFGTREFQEECEYLLDFDEENPEDVDVAKLSSISGKILSCCAVGSCCPVSGCCGTVAVVCGLALLAWHVAALVLFGKNPPITDGRGIDLKKW